VVGDSHAIKLWPKSCQPSHEFAEALRFTALDVRLPYDKWKARLISIRDRLTTQEGSELLEANHGKL
jgi:hypothetical protein